MQSLQRDAGSEAVANDRDDLSAALLARGLHPEVVATIVARYDPSRPPFHQLTVDEVRSGDRSMSGPFIPGPEVFDVEMQPVPGPYGEVPLRIYRPSSEPELPVLVYLHGGGWMLGSLESADSVCRCFSAEARCVVVSVAYRLAPEHRFPTAVEESYAVTAWIAEHAKELNGDAARLAVGGDSAGGTMAAAICLMARDRGEPQLAFQLLINPAIDMDLERPSMTENAFPPLSSPDDVMWFLDRYLRDRSDLLDPRALPINADSHRDLPPAFVLTAEFDILRDGGEAYAELLRASDVEASSKRYAGMTHGFFDHTTVFSRSREAMSDAVHALQEAFARS